MKITITKTEITQLLNAKYNLNLANDDIAITDVEAPTNFEKVLRQALTKFPDPHQKIAAIKELRTLAKDIFFNSSQNGGYGVGLGEAKYAIENPDLAIAYFIKNGKVHGQYDY